MPTILRQLITGGNVHRTERGVSMVYLKLLIPDPDPARVKIKMKTMRPDIPIGPEEMIGLHRVDVAAAQPRYGMIGMTVSSHGFRVKGQGS